MTTRTPPAPRATAAAAAPSSAAAVRSSPDSELSRWFEDYFLATRDSDPTT